MSKTTIAYVKLVRDEHGTIIDSENADHLALSYDEAFMAGGQAMREHMVFCATPNEWMQEHVAAERRACAMVAFNYGKPRSDAVQAACVRIHDAIRALK